MGKENNASEGLTKEDIIDIDRLIKKSKDTDLGTIINRCQFELQSRGQKSLNKYLKTLYPHLELETTE